MDTIKLKKKKKEKIINIKYDKNILKWYYFIYTYKNDPIVNYIYFFVNLLCIISIN